MKKSSGNDFTIKTLSAETWPDFARVVEKHHGIWGGCWCMAFHFTRESDMRASTAEKNRIEKEHRVRSGNAHAALVYDGETCIGWCQFGSASELPRVESRRKYAAESSKQPDWRIPCFFVDRNRRNMGVARIALGGALEEIARLGGGVVEACPFDTAKRPQSWSFNWGGTISMFEREGFTKAWQLAPSQWVMTKFVERSKK